jgi:CMP-N,N'-diacetyllegionaminic acid synthase
MVNCLAVIPCRGGSKGVHRKNLRKIGGIPLVAHTINAANASTLITRTIVSTDDEEIAAVTKEYGGDAPFVRPAEFSTDESKSIDVAMHALRACMQNGEHYDIFVLLQPTTPLRSAQDIDSTIQLLIDNPSHNSAITVKPVGSSHPNYLYKTVNDSGEMIPYIDNSMAEIRRQEFADIYVRNGAVYAVRASYMLENSKLLDESVLAHQMSEETSVNIDDEFELYLAQQIYNRLHS